MPKDTASVESNSLAATSVHAGPLVRHGAAKPKSEKETGSEAEPPTVDQLPHLSH